MTNNFEQYKAYIKHMQPDFPQSNKNSIADKFYVIELMRRGKDNPDMPAANIHFKNYYIYCFDDLEKYESEIIEICNVMRMRAYASVNWKSTKQIALNTVASMATRIAQGDYKKIYSTWSSETCKFSQRDENVWVIDLDDVEPTSTEVTELIKIITLCKSRFTKNVICSFKTKTGTHLLTRPFDTYEFVNKTFKNETAMKGLKEFNVPINEIRLSPGYMQSRLLDWVNESLIHKNHITLIYENV